MRGQRGVSPVIATVLLIAITIVMVGIVAAFVGGITPGEVPISVFLVYDNNKEGNTRLIVRHGGGDVVDSAFDSGRFKEMEVRINGAIKLTAPATDNLWLNGVRMTAADGIKRFAVGDMLVVPLTSGLAIGDIISALYKPTDQILIEARVVS